MADTLPEKIKAALAKDATLTVDQIAQQVQVEPERVEEILDSHTVEDDGSITPGDPGSGGGWASLDSGDDA